jgi:hypothetical protein
VRQSLTRYCTILEAAAFGIYHPSIDNVQSPTSNVKSSAFVALGRGYLTLDSNR